MNDRLKQFIEYLGISIRGFEQKISVSNGLIARFLSKNTTIQSDVLSKICNTFPGLNPDWLITGRGDMLRDSVHDEPDSATLDRLLNKISDLAQELGRAQAENAELKKELAQRDNTVVYATASVASA